MVSTFTPNKNLELPGYNNYVNDWNVPVNADFTAIDTALGGSTLLNATGISGDVVLTTTQYRPPLLIISGAMTANVRYLVPASVGGQWTVTNNTTGAYTLKIASAAGGADITLPAGTAIVSCDGTTTGMRRSVSYTLIANGGTGLSTSPTNGQVLIGNSGGGYTQSTLTAGSGISITNGDGEITISAPTSLPSGMVSPFAGAAAPAGWLLCDGAAVDRAVYSALFAVVGTTYGSGDGSTTFNVPDLRGRAVFGRDNMGGTAANRITAGVSGISGTTLGATGGDQTVGNHGHSTTDPGHIHPITDPSHIHPVSDPGHIHNPVRLTRVMGDYNGVNSDAGPGNNGSIVTLDAYVQPATTGISINNNTTGISINTNYTGVSVNTGGGGTGANIPPAIIMNYIIKT